MNNPLFEGGGDISSSVLEEETSLLFSAAPHKTTNSRPQVESHEPLASLRSEESPDRRAASGGGEAPFVARSAAEDPSYATAPSAGAKENALLIERIRSELALRRSEDSVEPSTRRPRLEKKSGRAPASVAAAPSSIRKKIPSTPPERAASSWIPAFPERKKPSSRAAASRSFLERIYGVPVAGYCVELLVHLFRLPSELRDIHVRSTKKETVVQARLDGMGSRVAALREGAALCRREMEAAIAGKADAEALAIISKEISGKVGADSFEAFTLNLETELARKTDAKSLQKLQSSLEGAFGELREEISKKAEQERLDVLEADLPTKADADFVRALEERLESLSERLELFDGNAALERAAAMESTTSLKADLALLKSTLSEKADADALDALEKRFENVAAELQAEVGKKADAQRCERLDASLSLKADVEAVKSLVSGKADITDVSPLEERLAALDTKTSELESAVEVRLSSKADAEAVNLLGGSLKNATERLGAFDGKTALERLESLESALELKADLEIVRSLLSLKMDVEVLKTLAGGLEKASGEALAALGKKADSKSVDDLLSALDSKADSSSLQTLAGDVSALVARMETLDAKADSAEVFSLAERLELLSGRIGELDMKAEAEAVYALGEKLESLGERLRALDAKADLELARSLEARMELKAETERVKSLEERVDEAVSILERKPDAESLAVLSVELNDRLAGKADSAAVERALASKAERADLDGVQQSVDGELGALHRRIEEQGERASEEERRLARFRDEVKALIASSLERGARAEIEDRFRANFPYVGKMKERSVAFRGLEAGGAPRNSDGRRSEDTKSRKRVKR